MLMYHDGAFLQALEGDELSVRGVFKRIEKDVRHAQVTILRNQRSFVERRILATGRWGSLTLPAPRLSQRDLWIWQ